MSIKIEHLSTPNKEERDKKQQDLISKHFKEVSPFIKLKPRQYSRSQGHAHPENVEGPVMYTISWCVDE